MSLIQSAKHNMLFDLPTSYLSVINKIFKRLENPFTILNTKRKLNKYLNLKRWGDEL